MENVLNDQDLIEKNKVARIGVASLLKRVESEAYSEEEYVYILESIASDLNYEVTRCIKNLKYKR